MIEQIEWFFRIIKENFKIDHAPVISYPDPNQIMTFNLRRDNPKDGQNNWMYRKNSILQMISSYKPGIIGVQECMPHMWKYLKYNLYYPYLDVSAEIVTGRSLDKTILFPSEGLGIFYDDTIYEKEDSGMFWLTENPKFFGRSWGNKTPRICLWIKLWDQVTHELVLVLNTHLDHNSSEARVKSCELIHNFIKSQSFNRVILMGDMNANYDSPDLAFLEENYFSTGFSKIGTVNHFRAPTNKIIDVIYSNKKIKTGEVIKYGYDVEFLSDHYPVICEFEQRPNSDK